MDIVRQHTGEALLNDLQNDGLQPSFLIEDFIYEPSTIILSADPGVGKTHIALEVAAALSTGEPLFGRFKVARPTLVSYLLLESTYPEMLRRIKNFRGGAGIDAQMLSIDEAQGWDFSKPQVLESFLAVHKGKKPGMVIVDTLSRLVHGNLNSDETAGKVANWKDTIFREWGCSFLFLHHLHKQRFSSDGKKIAEDDRMYGNTMIKAIFDAAFELEQGDQEAKNRPVLICKKDRAEAMPAKIQLYYDIEDGRCTAAEGYSSSGMLTKLLDYLRAAHRRGEHLDSEKIRSAHKISPAHFRRLAKEPLVTELYEVVTRSGKTSLWIPRKRE